MPAALAAAHIGHQIEHSSALMGFLVGAAIGLAVGVAIVAVTVATGGAALAMIAAVGGAVAATGGGALAGMYVGEAHRSPKGPISTGSANVYYGPQRIPAARAVLDTVSCSNHGTKRIAKLGLISAVPPLMLKTADNPDGLPLEVFDGIRAASVSSASGSTRIILPLPSR